MSRTMRGALAGAAAAVLWAAQQPLDRRLFGVDYDDTELLGRWVGGRPGGLALHIANGGLFGAIYAQVAPALPVAPRLRGPLAGLAEHALTWPGVALVEPRLWGSGRAFAQSAWRHLLFGFVLGELERRLNAPAPQPVVVDDALVATNGHGSFEHVATPL